MLPGKAREVAVRAAVFSLTDHRWPAAAAALLQATQFGTLKRRHHCRACGHVVASCCIVGGIHSRDITLDKVLMC